TDGVSFCPFAVAMVPPASSSDNECPVPKLACTCCCPTAADMTVEYLCIPTLSIERLPRETFPVEACAPAWTAKLDPMPWLMNSVRAIEPLTKPQVRIGTNVPKNCAAITRLLVCSDSTAEFCIETPEIPSVLCSSD